MRTTTPVAILAHWLLLLTTGSVLALDSFTAFESGPVRPLALSPDGQYLFATNTPDNRLEVFGVSTAGLTHLTSVPVGMEPVAVAIRSNTEAWVVNHLSDSVSIVRITAINSARVVRTLAVGDEPRDIVFGSKDGNRAFITAAHREDFDSPGAGTSGNADVWVFDANNLGAPAPGVPLEVINLFSDVPRALAVSPDGATVYAAALHSGNQTAVISRHVVQGDLPPPLSNFEGEPIRDLALIVKWNGQAWIDGGGRDVSHYIDMVLPDKDVFVIDANAANPAVTDEYSGVGTTLFNLAVDPQTGTLFVSNTEAQNHVRFEGPGIFGGSTVRGHFIENRITAIDTASGSVSPRHLNKHIDYNTFPGTQAENDASLAMPLEMVIQSDGSTLYAAAYGSSKIGIFAVDELLDDTFTPGPDSHVEVSGGGPGGLVLDEARNRLYVLTRFDNAISIIDLATRNETAHIAMFNPEPASITDGRRFLYDARHTSSRGDSACGGCHIFGDNDQLGWNLGDPDAPLSPNPNPMSGQFSDPFFHPVKGPMTTQSLRGLAGSGPMHWRGDRTGGNADPPGDPLDEDLAFKAFNGAFEGLIGRTAPLSEDEMQQFADFALQLTYPPNPNRPIDNSLSESQALGREIYFNDPVFEETCHDCHTLIPEEQVFGADGLSIIHPGVVQALKIPHFRNLYTKIGIRQGGFSTGNEQIRGFAFLHDGVAECPCPRPLEPRGDAGPPTGSGDLKGFLSRHPFQERLSKEVLEGSFPIDHVENFLMVYPTNLAPIVGAQVTFPGHGSGQRIRTFLERDDIVGALEECDLIAKGVIANQQRGWYRTANGFMQSDIATEQHTVPELIQASLAAGQNVTFTCVPPGAGVRMGVDRDEDGVFDRDEIVAGSNPADAASTPASAIRLSAETEGGID